MLIGRGDLLAELHDEAELARSGVGRLVVVSGDAGIGKSLLIDAVANELADSGFIRWTHTATPPEQAVPWATILNLSGIGGGDGLRDALAETILAPHRVASALRQLFADLAARDPLLVVLDDEQWIDAASAGVLTFALRAVTELPVLVVAGRRTGEPGSIDASAARWQRTITVGGLAVEDVAVLIRRQFGLALQRSQVMAIHRRSAGNPMWVLEMGRRLAAGDSIDEAVAPRSLIEVLRPRLDALDASALTVLQHAALLAEPTAAQLDAALDHDAIAALAAAETGAMLTLRPSGADTRIEFAHPTIATAAVELMSTFDRRAAHRRLAEHVANSEERALHLAAAQLEPTEPLAVELEAAGDAASARGAPDAAGRLYAAATAATPVAHHEQRRRRQQQLVRAQHAGGAYADVLATLATIDAAAGSELADWVVLQRVKATYEAHGVATARQLAAESLPLVADPTTRIELESMLAALFIYDDAAASLRHSRRVVTAIAADSALAGSLVETQARLRVAAAAVATGERVDLDDVVALAGAADDRTCWLAAMIALAWAGDARVVEIAERLSDDGDPAVAYSAINARLLAAATRGEFELGRALIASAFLTGQTTVIDDAESAYLLAMGGERRAAERRWTELLAAPPGDWVVQRCFVRARHGSTLLMWGRYDDAAAELELAAQLATEMSLGTTRGVAFRRDLVEALVACGRIAEAVSVADRLDIAAERIATEQAGADAAAVVGTVAAATGADVDDAVGLLTTAAKRYESNGDHYEQARTQLTAGRALRRAGQRAAARRRFDTAIELFDDLGAVPWSEIAGDERARLGGRPRRTTELTATERKVAERAAAGASNAEIAAAMSITVRTVESNLTRCYRKLGIRRRGELAAVL